MIRTLRPRRPNLIAAIVDLVRAALGLGESPAARRARLDRVERVRRRARERL